MKTDLIFFIAIFIIAVLFIGHFRLTFSPFSISLPYWHRALGVVLIVAGCLVYNIGEHMSGYKKGLDNGMEIVLKQLRNGMNDQVINKEKILPMVAKKGYPPGQPIFLLTLI